ncbi:ectonucleotide pyrophosphatase/phosphodiesterase [Sphingomonas sp. CROZ-RG-20F-R02-07]|uniref:alkaline phosphatase family protein n=1 Tax=Sphingomonas sp. CROZ-RG-20F-R02-07 TaxID=2914832 RepID=UPI001F56E972|nr:ectonucleotide pyrophosphatase/phosphodiesterase [Sphingomonas sp. CROZ-RG-20F-R02-07]
MLKPLLAASLLALAAACTTIPPAPTTIAGETPAPFGAASPRMAAPLATAETPDARRAPVTILISIDGFRPDYLTRGVTPHLNALAATGVSASMRPSFPTKTFPNHWTLVTGLVPDHHGIVGNRMEDVRRPGTVFTMATDDPFWWNAAEPIWVTAKRAGIRTATMLWPGANVAWGSTVTANEHGVITGGVRPDDWAQYNANLSGDQRVDTVIDWLRRPAATRPGFVTLYFDTVDAAGHDNGPDSPAVTAAVADVDREIGRLVAGLAALHQPADLVIVADHGMAATSSTRVVALDDVADPADYRTVETGPYATLVPVPGHAAALERAILRPIPHMTCWRKDAIPARLRFGTNPRVPPYLCLAQSGWLVENSSPTKAFARGNHGYDNADPAMAALFVANGPRFAAGRRLAPFDNVDVAPLLRDLMHLPAGQGLDGDDRPFDKVLQR